MKEEEHREEKTGEKKLLDLSIVIPVYNEEENVEPLFRKTKDVLDRMKLRYEIIFVDDGSRDKTFQSLLRIHDSHLVIIRFRRNFGQTAAMDAGFKHARGNVIVSMDGDLQNDPEDIPRLLSKIHEGYDVVCGWRRNRKDPLAKRFISRGADLLRKLLLHDRIHDSGCSLKAYRKECLDGLDLYGEMHRFIPALLGWKGFSIAEIVVKHHPRRHGKTKYTMKRVFNGFLDMLLIKFWMQYSARPIHLFGGMGIVMSLLGFIIGVYLAVLKLAYGLGIGNRPLLLLAVLLIVLGTQFLIFGVLADILIKVYYKDNKNYAIERIVESK